MMGREDELTFTPDILSRVVPELIFQRNLSIGTRMNNRKFEEFAKYQTNTFRDIIKDPEILGSSILEIQDTPNSTTVFVTIKGGVVEDTERPLYKQYEDRIPGIYPVVEIERGRGNSPPSDEEMIVGQLLNDILQHCGIISCESLKINIENRNTVEKDEIDFLGLQTGGKRWKFVLYIKINVFNRDGPIFHACWNAIMTALRDTRLPQVYINEENLNEVAYNLRLLKNKNRRNRFQSNEKVNKILCFNQLQTYPLRLNENNICYGCNFGITRLQPEYSLIEDEGEEEKRETSELVLISDISREGEEASLSNQLNILVTPNGNIKYLSLSVGDNKDKGNVSIELLKKSIRLAIERSRELQALNKKD
ncbi:hypothetical protein TBLA_0C06020 [Henningerozyma blattae CBS 6284]|uniref:Ribosomal RNA-processing protein 43 n=1 Tax=Henningerozyma blattae (strain ATCC 34711 / CBS 6284 / DSM 70876 / NBRC 10599 / NRRL Y-10934 / UCD 77-7) TaxID=1071380 RepID=I2H1Z7_HENB6|nr:hypothetical protein TBLA_0C06020 [Tetrapisispora blattae CBS 6284]CCH60399.1 hypothetical protein TBLA_0C06020 [Tetrapisispora blattae CBS 6284]